MRNYCSGGDEPVGKDLCEGKVNLKRTLVWPALGVCCLFVRHGTYLMLAGQMLDPNNKLSSFMHDALWSISPSIISISESGPPHICPPCICTWVLACRQVLFKVSNGHCRQTFSMSIHYFHCRALHILCVVSYLLTRWKDLCLHIIPNYLYPWFQNGTSYFRPILMLVSVLMESVFIYHDHCRSSIASIGLIYDNGSSIGHIQLGFWSNCEMWWMVHRSLTCCLRWWMPMSPDSLLAGDFWL